jgi:hypothetical protein
MGVQKDHPAPKKEKTVIWVPIRPTVKGITGTDRFTILRKHLMDI